ncbi:MAG: hypothetical protein R3C31_00940 [Hyphomonadaceae bacterium]
MNRLFALVWAAAGAFIGFQALSIALGPKGDASGWWLALAFAVVAVFFFWRALREWATADAPVVKPIASAPRQQSPSSNSAPGAWRGAPVPLETQIAALSDAGLTMAPGRSIEELFVSWPRADYEQDPYNLILFMYGSEVEAEPAGRWFCERGWNFDMECLSEAGDYAEAFGQIARITGQPQLVSDLSDNFDIDQSFCEIGYAINGRQRTLKARVDNDWADPEAATAFVRDLEAAVGDGRRFWAADNGQASVLFFLTDAEAAKINALRKNILEFYANADQG